MHILLQFQFYFLIFSWVIQTPRASLLGVVDGNKLLDNVNQCSYLNSVWSLAEPAYLFNTSFQFPSDWKSYKIHPINSFKRRFTWHIISNYRPISLLPILSKVIESIVYKNVIHFVHPQPNDVPIRLSYNIIAIDHASFQTTQILNC